MCAKDKNIEKEEPDEKRFLLSERDFRIFFNALENPPEPNEHLKLAVVELNALLKAQSQK